MGTPGGAGLFLYFNYWETPPPVPPGVVPPGATGLYNLSPTPLSYSLVPLPPPTPGVTLAAGSYVFQLTTTQTQFEFTPGIFDATIFCSSSSGANIQISSITLNQPLPSVLYGEITLYPGSNVVAIPSATITPVVLTGIIGSPPGGGSVYVVPTNSTLQITIAVSGGSANINFQDPAGYSLITLSTAVLVQGPTGPIGPPGPVGPTGNNYWGPTGVNDIVNLNNTGSVIATSATYYSNMITNPMLGGLIVQTTTGTERLILGAYYTQSINSACAIQASDYYSNIDHSQPLQLNPLGGNVGIGINSLNPSTALYVSGTTTSTDFNAISDYRIKENVHALDEGDTIDGLRPVKYLNKLTKGLDIGLIAHELQEFYPFLVKGEKDGPENQSVNYIGLIGVLIKEIQELKARVSKLEKN
jgi:hypothetical protein